MFAPVNIDIVGAAYHIAADYLTQAGRIAGGMDVHQRLLDLIVEDFRNGNRNQLRLANRAIARIEKAGGIPESIS